MGIVKNSAADGTTDPVANERVGLPTQEFIQQRMGNNSSPAGLPRSVQAIKAGRFLCDPPPRDSHLIQTGSGINQI